MSRRSDACVVMSHRSYPCIAYVKVGMCGLLKSQMAPSHFFLFKLLGRWPPHSSGSLLFIHIDFMALCFPLWYLSQGLVLPDCLCFLFLLVVFGAVAGAEVWSHLFVLSLLVAWFSADDSLSKP